MISHIALINFPFMFRFFILECHILYRDKRILLGAPRLIKRNILVFYYINESVPHKPITLKCIQ